MSENNYQQHRMSHTELRILVEDSNTDGIFKDSDIYIIQVDAMQIMKTLHPLMYNESAKLVSGPPVILQCICEQIKIVSNSLSIYASSDINYRVIASLFS